MKKGVMRWDDEDSGESSPDESSSSSGSDSNAEDETGKKRKSRKTIARFAKKDKKGFDYESLQQHGYKSLGMPDIPSPEEKPNWCWSTGKEKRVAEEVKETYREREATRAAIADGEKLENAQTRRDKKNITFSQKEKRKRDMGQASRGKNYVEEEKRLLRDNGVYSGFDS